MATHALATLQATALTSRCHNSYFRQEQLKSLHDTLRKEIDSICDALRQDTACTEAEATVEIATALEIVKGHYASINPQKELEEEYGPACGSDARDRLEPWGLVYIEPNLVHTPFLTVLEPLSAAIAAGNCVALKLENTSQALPSVFRTLLPKALQPDTFQIFSKAPLQDSSTKTLSVLQESRVTQPMYTQLVSSPGRVIAVVDRTADLSSAAGALVTARFSYGGTSPYAPDLVLVNEFVKTAFVEQVLNQAICYLARTSSTASNDKPRSTQAQQSKSHITSNALASLESNKQWDMSIITQGSAGAIVDLVPKQTTHVPLPSKPDGSLLAISAISSLDHAIDLIFNDSDERLSAAYHFAAPTHAKYLSQFIHADATFINHIPSELLLGPAAPLHHPIDINRRYKKELFLRPAPVFVKARAGKIALSRDTTQLLGEASKEIKEAKRAEWIAIGFFEQGILLGLGVYGVPILTCLGASLFFGVRAGLNRWVFV